MSRRNFGRQRPQRRLKGLAKAMSQAGVDWDPKAVEQRRRDVTANQRDLKQQHSRPPESVSKTPVPVTDWMPLAALFGMLFVGLFGYFGAEATLAAFPHPSHWIATVVVGFVGYAGGLAWHRMRGY